MTVLSRPLTLGLVPINNLPKHARKANYLYPDFPTFRVSTMNIRGYSSGTQNKERRRKVRLNITKVMRHSDVVPVQETKRQDVPVKKTFPDFKAYRNPLGDEAKAGEDIFIRRSLLENFNVTHTIHEEGYVHSILLTPKAQVRLECVSFTKSLRILNLYLPSPSEERNHKINILNSLADAALPGDYIVAAGDTNIISFKEDSSSRSRSDAKVRNALDRFTQTETPRGLPTATH